VPLLVARSTAEQIFAVQYFDIKMYVPVLSSLVREGGDGHVFGFYAGTMAGAIIMDPP
jgi:hypothetical protein